jgi:hypothetical protein
MKINATVVAPWQPVVERLLSRMRRRGLAVSQTFDLQRARQLLQDDREELCPYHGTAPCTCQYLVLQIGGRSGSPSAVVVHGHDWTTEITLLPAAAEDPDGEITIAVYEALADVRRAGTARRRAERTVVGQRDLRRAAAHDQ